MKSFMAFLTMLALGLLAWQKMRPEPPPPTIPPPPAILSEPAPVMDPEEQKKVLKSAEDTDPDVRWEAAVLLDKMQSPDAMAVATKLLHKDLEPSVRVRVAGLLGKRKGKDAVEALVRALKDQEPDVRINVLRALDAIGDYSVAVDIMAGPVKDQDEKVRLEALKVLNSLQDKRKAEIEHARIKYEAEKRAALEKQKGLR